MRGHDVVKRNVVIPIALAVIVLAGGTACFRPGVITDDLSWETPLKTELEGTVRSMTETLTPWVVPNKLFRVEDFGAVPGMDQVNTTAIQNAIDECSAGGGGVVLFSGGDYVTGTIELRSGVMIEVGKNSRILGSTDLRDYPEKIEKFKSVMSEDHRYRQSLIYAERASRVGIRGEGEVYFRGEKENFPGQEDSGEIVGRPFGIRMIECTNVVLENISLRNAAAWMQSYLNCRDLIFDGINVVNQANFNNDGLDLDGCTNVIVRNSHINSEDDGLCLKGASKMPSQNILIERSTIVSSCNALKIGTDTQGDFRNIVARDLVLGGIPDAMTAIRGHDAISGITLATVDGGNVEHILISNVSINGARCPIFLRVGDRLRVMPGAEKPPVGYLRKIIIENISGAGNLRQGSLISGIDGHYVEDVIIRNYEITAEGDGDGSMALSPVDELHDGYPDAGFFSPQGLPAFGFFIRHARRINIIDAHVATSEPDARPEFLSGDDAKGIWVNGKEIDSQF